MHPRFLSIQASVVFLVQDRRNFRQHRQLRFNNQSLNNIPDYFHPNTFSVAPRAILGAREPANTNLKNVWTFNGQQFSSEPAYLAYREAFKEGQKLIRELKDTSYEESFKSYSLFPDFNFALSQRPKSIERPTLTLDHEDYIQMRTDFETNGREIEEEDYDTHWPPLKLSEVVWELEEDKKGPYAYTPLTSTPRSTPTGWSRKEAIPINRWNDNDSKRLKPMKKYEQLRVSFLLSSL